MRPPSFEWDPAKDRANREEHGVGFAEAQAAFLDPHRLIFPDAAHGSGEPRFFCLGEVGGRVMTVRFTWRGERIRLIGAGFWRKGRQIHGQARG